MKKVILVAIVFLSTVTISVAQKIGYVDTDYILGKITFFMCLFYYFVNALSINHNVCQGTIILQINIFFGLQFS